MKHYKEVTVPAYKKTVLDKTTCDWCKNKIERDDPYDVEKVTIKHKTGDLFPEGGSGEIRSFDLCPECFSNELVEWFKRNGVEPQVEDWDI